MKLKIALVLVLLLTLVAFLNGSGTQAATQIQIDAAIDAGVAWLAANQNANGSWGTDGYYTANACLALASLEKYAHDSGFTTWDHPTFPYRQNIIDGWTYVFQSTYTQQVPIGVQAYGNPDTNGNGYGIQFDQNRGHESYTTGVCMVALELSETPDRPNDGGLDYNGDTNPDTFLEIAQEAVDWLSYGQIEFTGRGSWYYYACNNCSVRADQSAAGHATLGLAAGDAMGCTVPAFVLSELSLAIDYIQCNPGDPGWNANYDGGAGYARACDSATDVYKTGHLVTQLAFFGDDPASSARFERALAYLERQWRNTSTANPGWGYGSSLADYLAMFSTMKGLHYGDIEFLDTDGDGQRDDDWYNQEPPAAPAQDFATVLVQQQFPTGEWNGSCYTGFGPARCTAWALLTLQKAAPPPPPPPFHKTVDDARPDPGQLITFTIHIEPAADDTNGVISDTLPSGLEFAGPVTIDPPQPSAIVATSPYSLPMLVSGLTFTVDQDIDITYPVTVSLGVGESVTNTASLTSTLFPITPTVSAVGIAVPYPDLRVSKTVTPSSANPGELVTYTIAYSNAQSLATGVYITDIVPISVTVQSVSNSGALITDTGASPPYVWQVQDLTTGEGGIITITGQLTTPLASGVFTNTAQIGADGPDDDPGSNSVGTGVDVGNVDPVAEDDAVTVEEDSADSPLDVLTNDSDDNGDTLSVAATSTPDQGGTATDNIINVLYSPARDFVGTEVFTYTVDDGNGGTDYASVTVTVTNVADLLLSKSAEDLNGAPLHFGDVIEYTILVSSSLAADQTNVVVTDAIPNNTTYVPGSASVSQGSVSGPDPLVADIGTLTEGQVVTFTFQVTADGMVGELVENYAQADSDQEDPPVEVGPVTPPGGGVIQPRPDALELGKTAEDLNGAPLYPGDEIEYTILVTNALGLAQTNVVITDAIPSNTTYVPGSAAVSQGSISGPDPLVADIGTLAASQVATFTFRVIADFDSGGKVVENFAQADSDQHEPPANVGPITPPGGGTVEHGLAIEKTAEDLDGPPLNEGDRIRYTIAITNEHASTTMTNIALTDTLPAGVAFVSADPTQDSGPNPLVWAVGDLAPGASWTVDILVDVDGTADPIDGNYATVDSDQQNPQQVGPIGGGDVGPRPEADLGISKTLVRGFSTITFTVVVDNAGPVAADGAIVFDDVPIKIAHVTWSCVGTGGATCGNSGSGSTISDTLASFPSGSSVAYTIIGGLDAHDFAANTATVTPPAGIIDPDLENNSATSATRHRLILVPVFTKDPLGR